MNNPKRNHHVTPKFYLKGFAIGDKDPSVWVYRRGCQYDPESKKGANNPCKKSIRSAGVERDFYADLNDDGSPDFESFENKLESLEKPADPIFQKLRARQMIGQEEKRGFSSYIVQMYRRVQAGRERVRKLLAEGAYEPSNELFLKLNLPDIPETRATLKQIAESWTQKEGFDIHTHNRVTAAAEDSILIDLIEKMVWNLYTAPKNYAFLTSDNPVFISRQFGLKKNISEMSFPISTDVTLVASWSSFAKEGFSEATPRILKELNRRTVSEASQYVYFSEVREWVAIMLEKSDFQYQPLFPFKAVSDVVRLLTDESGLKPRVDLLV